MENVKMYIGTPCAVILCFDSYGQKISGRLYHGYSWGGIPFSSVERAFLCMEDFYNSIQFPFPGTEDRSFLEKRTGSRKERMTRMMKDEELLKKHGDMGTFIVRVQHRQNSSWQGVVTWTDRHKSIPFRSALELMKMIDEALLSEESADDDISFIEDKE